MGKIIRNGVEYSGATEDATAVNYNNSLSGLEAQTVQEAVDELHEDIESMKTSFQDGVDTLYNKCVSLGVTPTAKTPTAIADAMQTIYTNRYNAGVTYADGRTNTSSASYTAGYNAGKAAGNDIKHSVTAQIYHENGWMHNEIWVDGKHAGTSSSIDAGITKLANKTKFIPVTVTV